MSGQIFVPLRKRDRIEEIKPYLDLIARPAMQVVFLTPYREKLSWMEVQLSAMQTGIKNIAAITTLAADTSREAHLRSIEERIRSVREFLQTNGTTVVVQCYTGSLRNAVASLRDADSELIVLLGEHKLIQKFFTQVMKLLGLFRTCEAVPILFLRPRRQY